MTNFFDLIVNPLIYPLICYGIHKKINLNSRSYEFLNLLNFFHLFLRKLNFYFLTEKTLRNYFKYNFFGGLESK